jgi:hypothetical protein
MQGWALLLLLLLLLLLFISASPNTNVFYWPQLRFEFQHR